VGDARIVSQPSVLTFDSVEAIIDESETIHVRVAGNEDVDLFQVQTGTLLRVTPRVVDVNRVRDVELAVEIRDGDFDQEASVDDIPAVRESTLTTSAIVAERQGLLLGGLYRTSATNVDEKVPVLGDIPILGWAFRSRRIEDTSVIRLFLLTPTVIELTPGQQDMIELAPPPLAATSSTGFDPRPAGAGESLTPSDRQLLTGEPLPERLAARPAASSPLPRRAVGPPRQLTLPVPRALDSSTFAAAGCAGFSRGVVPSTIDATTALLRMRCSRALPPVARSGGSSDALSGLY
jgi:type III secretion protein C